MISIISIYHTSYWLASSEVISQLWFMITIHLRAAEEKQNGFCRYIVTNKLTLWSASYSACVIYTYKTIIFIHLSVSESGGYLPHCSLNIHHYSPPLRWIIVKYNFITVHKASISSGNFLFKNKDQDDQNPFSSSKITKLSICVSSCTKSYWIAVIGVEPAVKYSFV